MNVVGIVAEYNPFHSGHQFHIGQSRMLCGGDALIVSVMSGDFVQRGEAAIYDKFVRAEAACRCGADLVVELPLPWCLSSAEGFARGAVSLLEALRCDHLSFGSEAGQLEPLQELAELLVSDGFNEAVKERLSRDPCMSYASARQLEAEARLGACAQLLSAPNNILAVEYLKALKVLSSAMLPVTVRRTGSEHDGSGGVRPSAAELRAMLREGKSIRDRIPAEAAEVYDRAERAGRGRPDEQLLETAILSRLRFLSPEQADTLPDAGDGLGQKLLRAADAPSLGSTLAAAKSRRYALSRIRRVACCAALGLTAGMADGAPPYARVLAANERGRAHLRTLRDSSLPIVVKPASVRELGGRIEEIFELGARAHDLYALAYPSAEARGGGEDWRTGPGIL